MGNIVIRDAEYHEIPNAIHLLFSNSVAPLSDPELQAKTFLDYLHAQGLDLTWSLVLASGDRVVGSCVGVESPGRVGMILLSSCAPESDVCNQLAIALKELEARARQHQLVLMQALGSNEEGGKRRALELAGYKHLAGLRYLALPTCDAPDATVSPTRLSVECYGEENRSVFHATLAKTYIDSLDCPMLGNLRAIDDVILTHQATGIHDPKLWFLAKEGDEPVAVLLLTRVPIRSALEIVYVGVVPEFRGKKYGKDLVCMAIQHAQSRQCDQLILAVDQHNRFALEMYESLGFIETDRRQAWILAIIAAATR